MPTTNPWTAKDLRSRLRVGLDGGSVDQLDAALRGLAVGIVLALSLVGYKYSPPAGWVLPFPVAPAMVELGLVL